jgi:aspartyl-tRNA(Asn)/glutamyl-tRNA(Gln) amidotransferase subunit A
VVTGAEIREAIRTRRATVVEIIEDALLAAEGDTLNSFIEVDRPGALERARDLDARLAAGDDPGPLTGIPIGLKDLMHHAGHVTTAGSSFYRHHATTSATAVQRLEDAGAVIVGRTGLHEFAYGFNSENEWFGPVRNPWDPTLSPGGSSGGSGAAVGAGLLPIAIGTDTGGSVRVPAALCGIVGLKVTHGRVPTSGVVPLAESMDTVGPLAATVDDVALAYEAMAGDAIEDPWSVPAPTEEAGPMPLDTLRAGIPVQWLADAPMTAEARAAFTTAVDALADLGVTVVELDSPTLAPSSVGWLLSAAEAASVHRGWFPDPEKAYGQQIESRLAAAMEVSVDQYIDARRWQAGLVGAARRAFETVDTLLLPTAGHNRKVIGEETIDVDGESVHHRAVLAHFTATVNQMWCPAIALPLTGTGTPPHSIQLVGSWWSEPMLLDVGRQLEATDLVGFELPPA